MKLKTSIWRSLSAVGSVLAAYVSLKMLDESIRNESSWNNNWDQREPQRQYRSGLMDVIQGEPVAARYILLVRHGQDSRDHLTQLGRRQAHRAGHRLLEMGAAWDHVVTSTSASAQETAEIILRQMNSDPRQMKCCELLAESIPYPPDPPLKRSIRSLEESYLRDGPRIEAAFRRYFFRASPEQQRDSFLLIVGDTNVLRYFVCRALQFPPNAWSRLSLHHGSMTWLSIWPNGHVSLRSLGETGFMSVNEVTS